LIARIFVFGNWKAYYTLYKMVCQDICLGVFRMRKCMTIGVVLLVWFCTVGGVSHLSQDVAQPSNKTQVIGSLGLGLQTGTFTGASHVLTTGFFIPFKSERFADFNTDGVVNFSDFLLFASGFGRRQTDSDYNQKLDLNRDGEIGFSDFILFAAAFTG